MMGLAWGRGASTVHVESWLLVWSQGPVRDGQEGLESWGVGHSLSSWGIGSGSGTLFLLGFLPTPTPPQEDFS